MRIIKIAVLLLILGPGPVLAQQSGLETKDKRTESKAVDASSAPTGPPNLKALNIGEGTITIDGQLTEAVWLRAHVSQGFVERTPNPGEPAPVDSTVRVVYDADALYVAVENELMPGERPVSMELRRDSFRIWSDDTITLKFDVLLDELNTVGFATNAAGAQTDYLSLNSGRQFRLEYDAIWETASTVVEGRWVVEFRIPYTALGLPASEAEQIIGFNVTRDHNGRAATYDLAHMPPEFGPTAATHYGRITGLRGVGNRGNPLRLIPYLSGVYRDERGQDSEVDGSAGLDLRIRFGTDFWGEATVLTDFAEVDLDDALINLSRFPLFLPEKRAFFLSGLHIYEFGAPRQTQVFFSRRIGLNEDGDSVPILGGGKLYGNIGKWGIGGLYIVTDQTETEPMSSFGLGRITRNVGGRGQVGAIVVHRTALDNDSELVPHVAGGFDASMRFLNDRLFISGFAAWTAELCSETIHDHSEDIRARYKGKRWQPSASVQRVGGGFDPKVGFVRRTDIVNASFDSPVVTRWKTGFWSAFEVGLNGYAVSNADVDRYLESGGGLELSGRTRTGHNVYGGLRYSDEKVDEAFDLLDDLSIDPGRYSGPSAYVGASSSRRRSLSGNFTYSWAEGFYGGTRQSLNLGIGKNFGAHVRINFGGQGSALKFPNRETDWTAALNGSLGLAWNTKLFLDTIVQANTVEETGRVLSRLRWRYHPGSDLFVVYRHELDGGTRLETAERQINIKLTFWYDSSI